MAEVRLDAELRTETGKGPSRRARAAGRVPATIYGRGMEPLSVTIDRRAFVTALHTDAGVNQLLDVHVGGDTVLAITKELQRDPVKGTLLHADLVKVDRTTRIDVEVPVHLVGESEGQNQGGVLEQQLHTLQIRCLPAEVPDAIEADVGPLGIGDTLRVGDLRVAAGVEVLSDPDEVVAVVSTPISEEEFEALETEAGIETGVGEERVEEAAGPETVGEGPGGVPEDEAGSDLGGSR